MKSVILLVLLFYSVSAFSREQTKSLFLEVVFERENKSHHYSIYSEVKNNKEIYILSFANEKQKVKTYQLSLKQYQYIKSEATRIIWENQFRNPASQNHCREYVRLKTMDEKARVCYHNVSTTGKSFGFLNSLNRFFM